MSSLTTESFQGRVLIHEESVNIFAPYNISDFSETNPRHLGIPEFSFSRFVGESLGAVVFEENPVANVTWSDTTKVLNISGQSEDFNSGIAVTFGALTVSEHLRQLAGRILSHGACVLDQNDEAIMILGNQGDGKTSFVLALCMLHGYRLIGNDQIIFGTGTDRILSAYGGTKFITIRHSAAKGSLGYLRDLFPKGGNKSSFENKIVKEPEELGIQTATGSYKVRRVAKVHIDATGVEKTKKVIANRSDLLTNLFIAERLSRHISAVATPLINDRGFIVGLYPSLDNAITRQNRMAIIDSMFGAGILSISGSDLNEMVDLIKE